MIGSFGYSVPPVSKSNFQGMGRSDVHRRAGTNLRRGGGGGEVVHDGANQAVMKMELMRMM
jgi:hypothetical protein